MKEASGKLIMSILILVSFPISHALNQESQKSLLVKQKTFFFQDTVRNRELVTEIWYPVRRVDNSGKPFPSSISKTGNNSKVTGKLPLIVFSHGTGGGRLTAEWFCKGLAAEGFIVAAVDHYGNTFDNPIKEEFVKVWERPLDLIFITDEILRIPKWASLIDSTSIGAAGFSLGGFSVAALAGATMDLDALINFSKTEEGMRELTIPEMPGVIDLLQEPWLKQSFVDAPSLKNPKIKAAFLMAPALGQAFPQEQNFSEVQIPFFVLGAGKDSIAPLMTNAQHYAENIKKVDLKIVDEQAGHYIFLNEGSEDVQRDLPLYFSDPSSVDRKEIHQQTLETAIKFFNRTLK